MNCRIQSVGSIAWSDVTQGYTLRTSRNTQHSNDV